MINSIKKLLSGTILSQIIAIIGLIFLSNIYGPKAFGTYSIILSMIGIFTIISSFAYEQSIPLPKVENNTKQITIICFINILIIGLIISPITYYVLSEIGFINDSVKKIENYIILIGLCILSNGIIMVYNFWSLRYKYYSNIRNIKIIQSLLQLIFQICLYCFMDNGLFYGYFISVLIIFSYIFYKMDFTSIVKSVHCIRLFYNLKKYKRFPLFSTWEVLLNGLSIHLIPILLSYYLTTEFTGQFSLSFRLVSLPMVVLGTVFSQYLFSKTELIIDSNGNKNELNLVLNAILLISFMSFCLIFLFSKPIFLIILGNDWCVGSDLCKILSFSIAAQLVGSPLSSFFPILQQQLLGLKLQILLVLLRVSPILIFANKISNENLIFIFSVLSFISYSVMAFFALKLLSINLFGLYFRFLDRFKLHVIFSLIFLIILECLEDYNNNPFFVFSILIIYLLTMLIVSKPFICLNIFYKGNK